MKIPCRLSVRQFRVRLFRKKKRCVPFCLAVSWTFLTVCLLLVWVESVVQVWFSQSSKLRRNEHAARAALVELTKEPYLDAHENEALTDNDYEMMIQEDEKRIVPGLGDGGVGVKLTGEEAERGKADYELEGFNLELSKKIALNRTLAENAHPNCSNIEYPEDIPPASVIIVFRNERWSSLLRTIHSVINRSPSQLINEIILVDDCSTYEELKGKLDYYIRTRLPKYVKLFRMKSRSGLIRARLKGAELAKSKILVFIDAHCEASNGWLTPLLARVNEDRKNVVVPIIDHIDLKTLDYIFDGYEFRIGTFTWTGYWVLMGIPPEDRAREPDLTKPMKSPTMAGGLFAIDRSYFYEIGSYDDEMEIWGGENLEMSFRIWQCGGSLEVVPCSRVGHMFRSYHRWVQNATADFIGINIARMVRVWWDEYAKWFFMFRPDLVDADVGDLTARIELRKRLKCRPFSWFLREIHPTKLIFDKNVRAYGNVEGNNNVCLDLNYGANENYCGFYPCERRQATFTQYWALTKTGQLMTDLACATVDDSITADLPRKAPLKIGSCDGEDHQKWEYTEEGFLRHVESGLCLDSETGSNGEWVKAEVNTCEPHKASQLWSWEHLVKEPTRKNRPRGNR